MIEKTMLACCGFYCGDRPNYSGTIADAATGSQSTISRRHSIAPFNEDKLTSFLKTSRVLSYELMNEGKCNSSYKITLSSGEVHVLKIYNRGSTSFDQYILNMVQEVVPVPAMLFAEDDWAILSFIAGQKMRKDSAECIEAVKLLGRLRALKFDRPGQFAADGTLTSWHFGGLAGFVNMMLEQPAVQAWLSPEMQNELLKIITRERGMIEELDNESYLVHGDFNPKNILFAKGRVVGVLDWEFAHSGTPWMDVGNLLRHLGGCIRQSYQFWF